jgi:hypothetical protein
MLKQPVHQAECLAAAILHEVHEEVLLYYN